MLNIKKLITLVIVVVGVFLYAWQPTARSLYRTKADASSEYTIIGQSNESLEISQIFVPDNKAIQKVEVLINTAASVEKSVHWQLETTDGQLVAQAEGLMSQYLNESKNKFSVSFDNIGFNAGQVYVFKMKGLIGGIFYQTYPRFNNQTVIINGKDTQQTLVAKIVYSQLHLQTFVVLLGLIVYIVVFMSAMLKLFR